MLIFIHQENKNKTHHHSKCLLSALVSTVEWKANPPCSKQLQNWTLLGNEWKNENYSNLRWHAFKVILNINFVVGVYSMS